MYFNKFFFFNFSVYLQNDDNLLIAFALDQKTYFDLSSQGPSIQNESRNSSNNK